MRGYNGVKGVGDVGAPKVGGACVRPARALVDDGDGLARASEVEGDFVGAHHGQGGAEHQQGTGPLPQFFYGLLAGRWNGLAEVDHCGFELG